MSVSLCFINVLMLLSTSVPWWDCTLHNNTLIASYSAFQCWKQLSKQNSTVHIAQQWSWFHHGQKLHASKPLNRASVCVSVHYCNQDEIKQGGNGEGTLVHVSTPFGRAPSRVTHLEVSRERRRSRDEMSQHEREDMNAPRVHSAFCAVCEWFMQKDRQWGPNNAAFTPKAAGERLRTKSTYRGAAFGVNAFF